MLYVVYDERERGGCMRWTAAVAYTVQLIRVCVCGGNRRTLTMNPLSALLLPAPTRLLTVKLTAGGDNETRKTAWENNSPRDSLSCLCLTAPSL